MDYGQAKTILARIFREYKAFKDLEDVIEFANQQEQRQAVLQKDIEKLIVEKAALVKGITLADREVADADQKLKDLKVKYAEAEKKLADDFNAKAVTLEFALNGKKEEFFKEAARLEEAMEEAAGRLEKLNAEADAAEKRLAKAKAAYDKFKESI